MAMVTYILRKDQKPTPEEIAEIEEAAKYPVVHDEDCPETTDEEWEFYSKLMKKYNTNRVTKEMVLRELEAEGKTIVRGQVVARA